MRRPQEETKADLDILISFLTMEFGRLPTEDEVFLFIFGSNEDRASLIQNKGLA